MKKEIQDKNYFQLEVCDRYVEVVKKLQNIYQEYKNNNAFANAIGISKQSFSNLKNQNRSVSLRTLFLTKKIFPEINMNYIISGEGEILLSENKELTQKESEIQELQDENIRLKAHLYEMIMKNEDKK